MLYCRHTSEPLQHSVHTDRTACAFSSAVGPGCGDCGFFLICGVACGGELFGFSCGLLLVEVINKFFFIFVIGHTEFEFSFFGAQDDELPFHAAHHVEGSAGLAAQGHFQQVFLDACLNGLAQFVLDFEEAIGRAQTLDALMRPFVIVVPDPEPDAFPRGLEALELSPGEKLLPNGFPEPLNLAQRHRMLRAALEMRHPVLLQLGFKPTDSAPGRVLAAVVSEHLFGRLILTDSLAVHLDD